AVTDVLLDEDCVELGPDDGIGRADLEAGGVLAVLADVRHHQEGLAAARVGRLVDQVAGGRHVLDELHMAPVLGVQLAGVVEAVEEQVGLVSLEPVPLLAGDLAGLAADADAGVGGEADALGRHSYIPMRLGLILVKPRSRAKRSSGSATSSSTTGTAVGSFGRSTVTR